MLLYVICLGQQTLKSLRKSRQFRMVQQSTSPPTGHWPLPLYIALVPATTPTTRLGGNSEDVFSVKTLTLKNAPLIFSISKTKPKQKQQTNKTHQNHLYCNDLHSQTRLFQWHRVFQWHVEESVEFMVTNAWRFRYGLTRYFMDVTAFLLYIMLRFFFFQKKLYALTRKVKFDYKECGYLSILSH